MPYVNVKVAGQLTREQKEQLVEGISQVLQDVAGKPPSSTYVVIDEIDRGNWAKGGKLLDAPKDEDS